MSLFIDIIDNLDTYDSALIDLLKNKNLKKALSLTKDLSKDDMDMYETITSKNMINLIKSMNEIIDKKELKRLIHNSVETPIIIYKTIYDYIYSLVQNKKQNTRNKIIHRIRLARHRREKKTIQATRRT